MSLTGQKALDQLFRTGKRGRHPLLQVVAVKGEAKKTFGCNALRTVKGSVVRNRIKRQMRAICRLHQGDFQEGVRVFVLLTPQAVGVEYGRLEQALLTTAKRLHLLKETLPPSGTP